ncbi:MAG: hypothetical protein HY541_02810, partial [Deltaproteobacteria bacterium]|nr:hypothetical protein [Deltaproteobacteria bacterium]
VFLFFGGELLSKINRISERFFPALPLLPPAQEKFWLVLTLSLMITLVFLCYWGQIDIARHFFVVPPILVSKFVSTFFFFVFFVFGERALAYFVG